VIATSSNSQRFVSSFHILFFLLAILAALVSCSGSIESHAFILGSVRSIPLAMRGDPAEAIGDLISPISIRAPRSIFVSPTDLVSDSYRHDPQEAVVLAGAGFSYHQLIVELDRIYPLESLEWINYAGSLARAVESISIDTSMNGKKYSRIVRDKPLLSDSTLLSLNGISARFIRFVFSAGSEAIGVNLPSIRLGDGFIAELDETYTAAFYRKTGWTGADGIYSYGLGASDSSSPNDKKVGFVFGDTFIGEVFESNGVRYGHTIVNNSLAYCDMSLGLPESLEFEYRVKDGKPSSVFLADAYVGARARNLLDGDGLSLSRDSAALLSPNGEGTMWLSSASPAVMTIDLRSPSKLGELFVWNYAVEPTLGAAAIEVQASIDGVRWKLVGAYGMKKASGIGCEPYAIKVGLAGVEARFLRLTALRDTVGASVGLGKIMLFGVNGDYLFGQATASEDIAEAIGNERTARLWLQDGVVIGEYFFSFPVLVKDTPSLFKVHGVELIRIPIVSGRFDYMNTEYFSTPLRVLCENGSELIFGAAVLDERKRDGFVYVYGYMDNGTRSLIVSRFPGDDPLDFNEWRYFDGARWSCDATNSTPLIAGVAAEFSVTRLSEGKHAGKFMLVVMEGTTSGTISYAMADDPWGNFGALSPVYQTDEPVRFDAAFTYNAKMHPVLAMANSLSVSYNVNATDARSLSDARIYYPRFIRLHEVRSRP